jgi:Mg-chelatase subunit ChlI
MINEYFKKIFLDKDTFTDILGQGKAKQQVKSALLMNHHIIIVGPPGIGKTTLAKNIARLLPEIVVNDCSYHCDPKKPLCPQCLSAKNVKTKRIKGIERFVRIQGSPDLTVEDLLGDIDPVKALKFGPLSLEAFTPGKIFKANSGILFFDEFNRCPQKLQNALLQVLEEGKATVGSYDIDLPANFIFIGTMNPEDTSTEKLSDVLLDRFDLVYMCYPETIEIEKEIVLTKADSLDVNFPKALFHLAIDFVRSLRESDKLEKHPSVRASIALYERAQSNAFLQGKKTVTFDDILQAVISVLSHRIALKPSVKYLQSPADFIKQEFREFSENFKDSKEKNGDGP